LIPLRELIALLGLPRFSLARLALAVGLLIVAIGLAIAGFIGLIDALQLYLLRHVSAPVAALLVGLVLLALAGALGLIARRLVRPLPPPKRSATESQATAEALAWVQRHPGQSAVLAAVLGFCMGALPEARKAMSDLTKTQR
jgi:divalent metal cation (Fe/Co/Zn/Cd) transporter